VRRLKGVPSRFVLPIQEIIRPGKSVSSIKIEQFTKFIRSLRSIKSLKVNEIVKTCKKIDFEDTKRKWMFKFNVDELQESEPLFIDEELEKKRKIEELKALNHFERLKKKEQDKFLNSDLFDSFSVGNDISKEEFLKNEKSFEFLD
jgi:hypothetical protein